MSTDKEKQLWAIQYSKTPDDPTANIYGDLTPKRTKQIWATAEEAKDLLQNDPYIQKIKLIKRRKNFLKMK